METAFQIGKQHNEMTPDNCVALSQNHLAWHRIRPLLGKVNISQPLKAAYRAIFTVKYTKTRSLSVLALSRVHRIGCSRENYKINFMQSEENTIFF